MTLEDRVLDLLDRMLPAYLDWTAKVNQGDPDILLCTEQLTYAIHAGFSFSEERRSAQFAAAQLLWNLYAIYPDRALMEILRELDKDPILFPSDVIDVNAIKED
jgi:hypothetical protein